MDGNKEIPDINQIREDLNSDNVDTQKHILRKLGLHLTASNKSPLSDEEKKEIGGDILKLIKNSSDYDVQENAFACLNQANAVKFDEDMIQNFVECMNTFSHNCQDKKSIGRCYEACNLLQRLIRDYGEEIKKHVVVILECILTLLFCPATIIRNASVPVLQAFSSIMVDHEDKIAPVIAKVFLKSSFVDDCLYLFDIDQGMYALQTINQFLPFLKQDSANDLRVIRQLRAVFERGFRSKSADDETFKATFMVWKTLVENNARDTSSSNHSKKMKILLQPLALKMDKRISSFPNFVDTYWTLILSLKDQLPTYFDSLCIPLLEQCLANSLAENSDISCPLLPGKFRCASIIKMAIEMLIRLVEQPTPVDIFSIKDKSVLSKSPLLVPLPVTVLLHHFKKIIKATKIVILLFKEEGNSRHLNLLNILFKSLLSVIYCASKEEKTSIEATLGLLTLMNEIVKGALMTPRVCLQWFANFAKLPVDLLTSHHCCLGDSGLMHNNLAVSLTTLLLNPYVFCTNANEASFQLTYKRLVHVVILETSSALSYASILIHLIDDKFSELSSPANLQCMWSAIATPLLEVIKKTKDVNQGDSFENDFSCMYAILSYPVRHFLPPKVSQESFKSSLKLWTELYKMLIHYAPLAPSVEKNQVAEEFVQKFKIAISSINVNLQNVTYIESVYVLFRIIIEHFDFDDANSILKESFLDESCPSKRKPLGPMTVISEMCVLLIENFYEYLTSKKVSEAEEVENISKDIIKFTGILDLIRTIISKIINSKMIVQVLRCIVNPLSFLFTVETKNLELNCLLFTRLNNFWESVSTSIVCHYTDIYDANFLVIMSPIFKSTFQHNSSDIVATTKQFWSCSFALNKSLKYPDNMDPDLIVWFESVGKRSSIEILPNSIENQASRNFSSQPVFSSSNSAATSNEEIAASNKGISSPADSDTISSSLQDMVDNEQLSQEIFSTPFESQNSIDYETYPNQQNLENISEDSANKQCSEINDMDENYLIKPTNDTIPQNDKNLNNFQKENLKGGHLDQNCVANETMFNLSMDSLDTTLNSPVDFQNQEKFYDALYGTQEHDYSSVTSKSPITVSSLPIVDYLQNSMGDNESASSSSKRNLEYDASKNNALDLQSNDTLLDIVDGAIKISPQIDSSKPLNKIKKSEAVSKKNGYLEECLEEISASNTKNGDEIKKSAAENTDKNKVRNKNHDKQNDGSVISQDLFDNLSETDSATVINSSECNNGELISQKTEQNKDSQNVSDNLENSLDDESSIEDKSKTSQKRSPSKRNIAENKPDSNGPRTRIMLSVPRSTKNRKENSETVDDATAELHRSVSLGIRPRDKIERNPEKSSDISQSSQIRSTPRTRSAKSKSDQDKSLNIPTVSSEQQQISPRKRGRNKKNVPEGITDDTHNASESKDFNILIKGGKQNEKTSKKSEGSSEQEDTGINESSYNVVQPEIDQETKQNALDVESNVSTKINRHISPRKSRRGKSENQFQNIENSKNENASSSKVESSQITDKSSTNSQSIRNEDSVDVAQNMQPSINTESDKPSSPQKRGRGRKTKIELQSSQNDSSVLACNGSDTVELQKSLNEKEANVHSLNSDTNSKNIQEKGYSTSNILQLHDSVAVQPDKFLSSKRRGRSSSKANSQDSSKGSHIDDFVNNSQTSLTDINSVSNRSISPKRRSNRKKHEAASQDIEDSLSQTESSDNTHASIDSTNESDKITSPRKVGRKKAEGVSQVIQTSIHSVLTESTESISSRKRSGKTVEVPSGDPSENSSVQKSNSQGQRQNNDSLDESKKPFLRKSRKSEAAGLESDQANEISENSTTDDSVGMRTTRSVSPRKQRSNDRSHSTDISVNSETSITTESNRSISPNKKITKLKHDTQGSTDSSHDESNKSISPKTRSKKNEAILQNFVENSSERKVEANRNSTTTKSEEPTSPKILSLQKKSRRKTEEVNEDEKNDSLDRSVNPDEKNNDTNSKESDSLEIKCSDDSISTDGSRKRSRIKKGDNLSKTQENLQKISENMNENGPTNVARAITINVLTKVQVENALSQITTKNSLLSTLGLDEGMVSDEDLDERSEKSGDEHTENFPSPKKSVQGNMKNYTLTCSGNIKTNQDIRNELYNSLRTYSNKKKHIKKEISLVKNTSQDKNVNVTAKDINHEEDENDKIKEIQDSQLVKKGRRRKNKLSDQNDNANNCSKLDDLSLGESSDTPEQSTSSKNGRLSTRKSRLDEFLGPQRFSEIITYSRIIKNLKKADDDKTSQDSSLNKSISTENKTSSDKSKDTIKNLQNTSNPDDETDKFDTSPKRKYVRRSSSEGTVVNLNKLNTRSKSLTNIAELGIKKVAETPNEENYSLEKKSNNRNSSVTKNSLPNTSSPSGLPNKITEESSLLSSQESLGDFIKPKKQRRKRTEKELLQEAAKEITPTTRKRKSVISVDSNDGKTVSKLNLSPSEINNKTETSDIINSPDGLKKVSEKAQEMTENALENEDDDEISENDSTAQTPSQDLSVKKQRRKKEVFSYTKRRRRRTTLKSNINKMPDNSKLIKSPTSNKVNPTLSPNAKNQNNSLCEKLNETSSSSKNHSNSSEKSLNILSLSRISGKVSKRTLMIPERQKSLRKSMKKEIVTSQRQLRIKEKQDGSLTNKSKEDNSAAINIEETVSLAIEEENKSSENMSSLIEEQIVNAEQINLDIQTVEWNECSDPNTAPDLLIVRTGEAPCVHEISLEEVTSNETGKNPPVEESKSNCTQLVDAVSEDIHNEDPDSQNSDTSNSKKHRKRKRKSMAARKRMKVTMQKEASSSQNSTPPDEVNKPSNTQPIDDRLQNTAKTNEESPYESSEENVDAVVCSDQNADSNDEIIPNSQPSCNDSSIYNKSKNESVNKENKKSTEEFSTKKSTSDEKILTNMATNNIVNDDQLPHNQLTSSKIDDSDNKKEAIDSDQELEDDSSNVNDAKQSSANVRKRKRRSVYTHKKLKKSTNTTSMQKSNTDLVNQNDEELVMLPNNVSSNSQIVSPARDSLAKHADGSSDQVNINDENQDEKLSDLDLKKTEISYDENVLESEIKNNKLQSNKSSEIKTPSAEQAIDSVEMHQEPENLEKTVANQQSESETFSETRTVKPRYSVPASKALRKSYSSLKKQISEAETSENAAVRDDELPNNDSLQLSKTTADKIIVKTIISEDLSNVQPVATEPVSNSVNLMESLNAPKAITCINNAIDEDEDNEIMNSLQLNENVHSSASSQNVNDSSNTCKSPNVIFLQNDQTSTKNRISAISSVVSDNAPSLIKGEHLISNPQAETALEKSSEEINCDMTSGEFNSSKSTNSRPHVIELHPAIFQESKKNSVRMEDLSTSSNTSMHEPLTITNEASSSQISEVSTSKTVSNKQKVILVTAGSPIVNRLRHRRISLPASLIQKQGKISKVSSLSTSNNPTDDGELAITEKPSSGTETADDTVGDVEASEKRKMASESQDVSPRKRTKKDIAALMSSPSADSKPFPSRKDSPLLAAIKNSPTSRSGLILLAAQRQNQINSDLTANNQMSPTSHLQKTPLETSAVSNGHSDNPTALKSILKKLRSAGQIANSKKKNVRFCVPEMEKNSPLGKLSFADRLKLGKEKKKQRKATRTEKKDSNGAEPEPATLCMPLENDNTLEEEPTTPRFPSLVIEKDSPMFADVEENHDEAETSTDDIENISDNGGSPSCSTEIKPGPSSLVDKLNDIPSTGEDEQILVIIKDFFDSPRLENVDPTTLFHLQRRLLRAMEIAFRKKK